MVVSQNEITNFSTTSIVMGASAVADLTTTEQQQQNQTRQNNNNSNNNNNNNASTTITTSPIDAIIQEVRRKNGAAAASYVSTGGGAGIAVVGVSNSIDPWEDMELNEQQLQQQLLNDGSSYPSALSDSFICSCGSITSRRRRTLSGWNSPKRIRQTSISREGSSGGNVNVVNSDATVSFLSICPRCGKKQSDNITLSSSSSSILSTTGFAWATRRTGSFYHLQQDQNTILEEPKHAEALLQSTPQLRFLSPASTDMQGAGNPNPNFLTIIQAAVEGKQAVNKTDTASSGLNEYKASLIRDRINQQAAAELASLMWILAHEMSLEDYGHVESEVFTNVFALVHTVNNKERRMAGLAALDALLNAPSADEERKAIKFANTLSNGLRAAHGDFEFLSSVSKSLGHMATRTANVDFVESEMTRALEWLRTDRSDRRLAACLSLKEFATHLPTTFHSKTSHSTLGQGGSNEFLDHIFQAIRDPQPIVRACATDALSQCLKILVERQHPSLTGLLCQVHFNVMDGLQEDTTKKRPWHAISTAEASQHGSLLVVSSMLAYTRGFMIPRFEEVCRAVLNFASNPKALIRLEVVRLLPRLARRCPQVFGRRYLEESLIFLMYSASTPPGPRVGVDLRPAAYTALGQLIVAMTDDVTGTVIGGSNKPTIKIITDPTDPDGRGQIVELCESGIIYRKLPEIFSLVQQGLKQPSSGSKGGGGGANTVKPALHCAARLVEALGDLALPYISDLIDAMFRAGLSNDLMRCLQSIAESVPAQQNEIEERMLHGVSICLAGRGNVYDPLASYEASVLRAGGYQFSKLMRDRHNVRFPQDDFTYDPMKGGIHSNADVATENPTISINMSSDPKVVDDLVLGLETLSSFGGTTGMVATSGGMVPLLPFVKDVASQYLSHPSYQVRRASALTCCSLLIPLGMTVGGQIGSHSGMYVEEVLKKLLRTAISDPSPVVRLCVVRALDVRYDKYLIQSHHLNEIFLILQDEALATRAAGLSLLGRLASKNPGPILPGLRKLLVDLITELQCGVDTGRVREEATRLLVVFLRATSLQRLVHPVLPTLVSALPLNKSAPPRLASASLEALGELAHATGKALKPWLQEVVPHVLDIMEDRSSASKQRTSLRTLGQISASTGYVIRPYIDYPKLLGQATDILRKMSVWSLRREAIRTLGILGALDPDRYQEVASKTNKGGAVGGAYFEVDLNEEDESDDRSPWHKTVTPRLSNGQSHANVQRATHVTRDTVEEEEEPAYLFMYEQYAMVAQPVSSLPPSKRMTLSDEDFYPTVAIQALMRIFRDPSLAVHHSTVVQAVMFIFKSLGVKCVPFLNKVVPHMIHAIRHGPSSLRESLLMQLATLSNIVREHLRPFLVDIFDVVEQFWSSGHLSTIFNLISNLAVGSPDEFYHFAPRLIQRLLSSLDELQAADWSSKESRPILSRGRSESAKLRLILKIICNLRVVLKEYLGIIVPALLKFADSLATLSFNSDSGLPESMLVELSVLVYRAVGTLLETLSAAPCPLSLMYLTDARFEADRISDTTLPSRVVQPLVRTLREKPPKSPTVGLAIIETLCVCVAQIGGRKWLQLYDVVVRDAICNWQSTFPVVSGNELPASSFRIDDRLVSCLDLYQEAIEGIIRPNGGQNLPSSLHRASIARGGLQVGAIEFGTFEGSADLFEQAVSPTAQHGSSSSRQKVNQGKLQRAWDVSQRSSRDDWDEWMRRLCIQLLREAPSPALRATASLAHAYQPLARELFSAAFACCWKELSEPYRVNLVNALKTAFIADVSPEILQALLNLAEFMEHDPSGGLPIEIPVLAELALKCRAYAKALHYKEREYNHHPTSDCVESLISINGKLDLPEAALGILKASSMGETEKEYRSSSLSDEHPSEISKHQNHDMYYSVIWNTREKVVNNDGPVNLSAREELWLAKLGAWREALAVYEDKLKRDSSDFEALVGCMRCLVAQGEWQKVLELNNWVPFTAPSHVELSVNGPREGSSSVLQRKALRMCAQSAWRLGQWDDLEKFASKLVGTSKEAAKSPTTRLSSGGKTLPLVDFEGAFYSSVLHVHRKEWTEAANAIDAARRAMDGRLTALMAESYSRAYPSMVTAQTLAELEEIIEYRKIEERASENKLYHPVNRPNPAQARKNLLSVWSKRLAGCRVDSEVHASILAVRSLVLGPTEEVESILTLSELSRQSKRYKFAERVLLDPLDALHADLDGPCFGFNISEQLGMRVDFSSVAPNAYPMLIDRIVSGNLASIIPGYGPNHEQWSRSLVAEAGGLDKLIIRYRLYFEFLRHLWHTDRKDEALTRLTYLSEVVDMVSHCENIADSSLRVGCWLELGEWKLVCAVSPGNPTISELMQADVLTSFRRATLFDQCGYRSWHAWALLNFRIAIQISEKDDRDGNRGKSTQELKMLRNHVTAAVNGFVNAISQGTKKWCASVQQDLLNLVTCLFKYGNLQDVAAVINGSIGSVALEAFLGVLPQLLARIHIKDPSIRSVLHPLLTRLGEKHPQALMYPLAVLMKSPVSERKASAESLMNSLKNHSSGLVEEALMVSSELIRVAILWLETWHEGLEDASRLYYADGNVQAMLDTVLPLHEKLQNGPETIRESEFLKAFGRDLETAYHYIKEYIRLISKDGTTIPSASELVALRSDEAEQAMNRVWDLYYSVFRSINKMLPSLKKLDLQQCSPALYRARSLELGVPGSYRVDGSYVNIEKFIPNVEVITSKQRPRKITLRGSDGKDYVFLLKGHEDLRQDERVMQLFGLVNALLTRDPQTRKHDLKIQRYAICPLSHDCGVVGWVPHCDTLHSLIRDYRLSKALPLNMENREMLKIAPDYDLLTVMQKVEVFIEALQKTTGKGNDLYEILWLKSTNSEEWLERRTKFTRSLAVMSMVGYILGLGDRHPSNLMLDKISGRILHIDFGDCFEVAMNRDKFPEKVPFRLTRMLIKAMEVSGIEGSYRSTCERTMSVLRDSRDSLVAMLEAFVYDPLISWRLADLSESNTSQLSGVQNGIQAHQQSSMMLGVPIEISGRSMMENPISEEGGDYNEGMDDDGMMYRDGGGGGGGGVGQDDFTRYQENVAASRARSLHIYNEIQNMAANVAANSRIASITGDRADQVERSLAHSRLERSMRQREMMSLVGGEGGAAHEEALNEKALKVIRRVEDKLSGTDFPDCDGVPVDVAEQCQRLIVQATSSENLCQLFIGWCSFW